MRGDAQQKWSANYLAAQIRDKAVVVHKSASSKLNFLERNFKYVTMPFDQFVSEASSAAGDSLYLRSLGANARKDVANLELDFPEISHDIELPEYIPFREGELFFSSVLRVSSANVTLWTHYDVMDNALVQITGRKRVVLFPPEDVPFLYVVGDKSSISDIDAHPEELASTFPLFLRASRHETILEPGDLLFIPALWWHNVLSLTFSVGINVFWRDAEIQSLGLYERGDIYGNKDLSPAVGASANIDKALKSLDKLPEKYRKFYIHMMINKLAGRLK